MTNNSFQLNINSSALEQIISNDSHFIVSGRVISICGLQIKAKLCGAKLGDYFWIEKKSSLAQILAQVIGFERNQAILSALDSTQGITPGDKLKSACNILNITGGSHLLGSVINGLGQKLEDCSDRNEQCFQFKPQRISLESPQVEIKERIENVLETGIKAVDGFSSLGRGQRIAIFSEPGVGKTSLLSSLVKNSDSDINVIALIGERSREIREFIDNTLDPETRSRSCLVASTSSESAISRINAALIATSIAEYFANQGKNVLLTLDSLTRLFRAYREVGLARGEIPIRNGYPASVYEQLPKLIERAGNTPKGSITAIYSVLLSGSLEEDPMVEEVKGLTDGHILLDRKLAEQGQYPAINILKSLSRLQNSLVSKEHLDAAKEIRKFCSEFEEKKDLMFLSDARSEQYSKYEEVNKKLGSFLTQESDSKLPYCQTLNELKALAEIIP